MAYRDVDLSVGCPYCRASAGYRCRTKARTRTTMYVDEPHRGRIKLANENVARQVSQAD